MRLVSTLTTSSPSFGSGAEVCVRVAGEEVFSAVAEPRNEGMILGGRFGCGVDSEYVAGLSATGVGVGVGSILRPDWAAIAVVDRSIAIGMAKHLFIGSISPEIHP